MKRITPLAGLLLTGCLWITDAEHEERQDQDGDGVALQDDCDDLDPAVGLAGVWYTDQDGDGFGAEGSGIEACEQPSGAVAEGGDCDDGDAAVHPDAPEQCNGLDDDCDELVDDDDEGVEDGEPWYPDLDGDGYGDGLADPVLACEQPADHTSVDDALDCDDSRDDIYPYAPEYCDGVDTDCDGVTDEDDALDAPSWYLDGDDDGYGLDAHSQQACEQPSGYAADPGDCDDADAAFNPGAVEDDCTDPNDYNCDGSTGYADVDGDGYAACEDCDDGDAAVRPGAPEYCDGVDNDCDSDIDEADAVDAETWYVDADEDGWGSDASVVVACEEPSGYAEASGDCDDTTASVNPDQAEVCDGQDNDCDGLADDDDPGVDPSGMASWYPDADVDGYGDAAASPVVACAQPSGHVTDDTDCDDGDASVHPGADELPLDACFDAVDNDCDGAADAADAGCATCPFACAAEACLYLDGALEAEQTVASGYPMAAVRSLALSGGSFDRVLLGADGAVVVSEDFEVDAGCFVPGLLDGGGLLAADGEACSFPPMDLSGGGWVLGLDVLAGSGAAEGSLLRGVVPGTSWYDWESAPVLDDGSGVTVPFASGAPAQDVDHTVLLCGRSL
jgi:hypothetical protein